MKGSMINRLSVMKEKYKNNEKVVLSKKTETEEITKTIEQISNGWLLTMDVWNYENQEKNKCVKKYFEKNPLGMKEKEEEEDSEEMNSEFMESWKVLDIL
jgi:hypothetical protein